MIKDIEEVPYIKILGTRVHMIRIPEVVEVFSYWIESEPEKNHWVVNTGMHGITEAYKDPEIRKIFNSSDLFTPDGKPMTWIARYLGYPIKKRVCAPDFMKEFFKTASEKGYSNFFYGDTEETLERLVERLSVEFPDLKIAGTYSPPFRPLTVEEDEEIVEMINRIKPDVLWVGLGLPKQERWMFEHHDRLNVPVMAGVGASFKFLSGKVKRAPRWIGECGFEWLWRFVHEPKRMWRRVLLNAPLFVFLVLSELIRGKIEKRGEV